MMSKIKICSLEQAETIVSSINSSGSEQEVALYECLDSILDPENVNNVAGSADAFHNFSVSIVKIAKDFTSAFEIVELGLKLHPSNTDLLADAIRYGYQCGKKDACDKYYKILLDIDKSIWTWRAYSFIIDYLLELITSDNANIQQDELTKMADEYKKRYPDDEDGYLSEYEIQSRFGDPNAIDVIKKAMNCLAVCPKCQLRYADRMVERGQFSEAVNPIKELLKSPNAVESVNISYVYFLKGICQHNFLLKRKKNDSTSDGFDDEEYDPTEVQRIYKSFYQALISKDLYGSLKNKCLDQMNRVKTETGIEYPENIKNYLIDLQEGSM